MSGLVNNEVYTVTQVEVDDAGYAGTHNEKHLGRGSVDLAMSSLDDPIDDSKITDDDLNSLRRVSGKIPWTAFSVAFVELCERFSYYGTTVVCKSLALRLTCITRSEKCSRQLHPATASSWLNNRSRL